MFETPLIVRSYRARRDIHSTGLATSAEPHVVGIARFDPALRRLRLNNDASFSHHSASESASSRYMGLPSRSHAACQR